MPALPPAVAATGDALRAVLREVPTPVAVVTTQTSDGPRGATIGSFTSVSLAPPIVSFSVTRATRLHEALAGASGWAIHLLAETQAGLADHFAAPDLAGLDQLAPFPHVAPEDGPPLLRDTLGVLRCRPHAVVEAGDHSVFFGRVEDIVHGAGTAPLLYYRQSYRGVGGTAPGRSVGIAAPS